MKVILSRKGFDSGYGGYPSIILPNNEMITLPIPSEKEEDFYYKDLKTRNNLSLYEIMKSLNKNIKIGKNVLLTKNTKCHLDPDLCEFSVSREVGWRGAFGQINAAQTVLENNNVKEGDLFLFFGWFNDVEKSANNYKFKKGSGKHTIFGYLQIDKIIYPNKDEIPKWLKKHPHASSLKRLNNSTNCIYIAKEKCSFNKNIKGYGMFEYNEELDLSKKGMTRTCWNLPNFFKNVNITYHNKDSWKNGYFKSACRGQEFVIEENKEIEEWAIHLIESYSANYIKDVVKN